MGFPNRILRQHLGKKLRNTRPVENPEREVGAERLSLLEHTAVGAGLVVPRAILIARWSTELSAFQIYLQEEAWNVEHAQAHPVLARAGVGGYTYTFAPSYLDENGASVATDIIGVRVWSARSYLHDVTCEVNGLVVTIYTLSLGVSTDAATFGLEIW